MYSADYVDFGLFHTRLKNVRCSLELWDYYLVFVFVLVPLQAFNTFIDDLFAFIISMPTAHRVACFRDDVVFLIYLYQRW